MSWFRGAALAALAFFAAVPHAGAQGASTWYLAEGANNATFAQEILVGNPSAQALKVTVTLLPQSDAIAPTLTKTFDLGPSARLTVRLGSDFNLNGSASASVTAVLASDNATPADVVVERTMYFPGATQSGSHNASGVTQNGLSDRWTLAEGSGGVFETFVLVANPNPTPTTVRATYLTGTGESFVTEQVAPANSRVTLYPRGEHVPLASADFSTVIESLTAGNLVIAERAMYFDAFHSGHDALGVTGPSTTWLFAEGFTGGNAETAFETYLLLANTGTTDTVATVDYLLDNGQVVTRTYPLLARQRFTVWVDQEGRTFDSRLTAAAFGIRVTAASPIVAERAMYWGTPSAGDPTMPTFPWREGHATAGTIAGEAKWAFAEGQQGRFGAAATTFDTFFLLANPQNIPVLVQATFVREDGKGIVRTLCVAPNSRSNIWTAEFPELAGQRFATFLESINSSDPACAAVANTGFVAERAVYSGAGFLAGHVNGGTRWTGAIAAPPVAPAFAVTSVSPSSGRLAGGQTITITGAGFQQGAKVLFDNSTWTADRNANTKLGDVDQATAVVVSQDGTTITAKTPTRDFYNGYQTAGPTTVRVVNPDNTNTSLANGFTFKLNVLAFGDEYVTGLINGSPGVAATPFPARLEASLKAFEKDLLNSSTGAATGSKVLQFGQYVTVTNGGSNFECASATNTGCTAQSGQSRFPALADQVAAANASDAFDAVIFAEGVNDVEAGVLPNSVAGALRNMVASARDRKIVIFMTKYEETNIGTLSADSVKALGDAIWGVTTDTSLGVEIYRQSFFQVPTVGGRPTQAGYDRMASDLFTKLTREFPLQPCDARNDKPGKGCPRNP
ncbi:IPT/TIG domain protein [Luteitalea pratensis]|uniref:IPT/TIG domain protein n=1 Tax=Luteitalea pratensis TaxID=1855912 RepID=A0A143PNC4_LUTPR|nr:IPT/TIG domain-containing protein [Luteitalea pratensis]AMY09926.1 IPT/TIG domain protein [Luteitalea pratensis]